MRFAGETTREHGLFPSDGDQAGVLEQELGTSVCEICGVHEMRISDESREVVLVCRVLQYTLRDGFAFGVVDGFVGVADNVENYIVVSGVEVMAVLEPVRRVDMDFDIANPVDGLACGLGVGLGIGLSVGLGDTEVDGREVRSCICVVYTDGQHFEMPSVGGELRERTEDFPLPDVMEEYFRHLVLYGGVCGRAVTTA